MSSIVSKVLKTELLILFILTVISFFSFYYQDSLPDNLYSITSSSDGLGVISYYSTSIIAIVGYYFGPWVFFPFVIFALSYSLIFSKRESVVDLFNIVSLSISFLLLTYILLPEFLGSGAFYVVKEYMAPFSEYLLLFIFVVCYLAGTYRGSFKNFIITCSKVLAGIPRKLLSVGRVINPLAFFRKTSEVKNRISTSVRKSIPKLLKGEKKQEEESYTFIEREDFSESLPKQEQIEEEINIDEAGQSELSLDSSDTKSEPAEAIKNYKKKKTATSEKQYYDIVTSLNSGRQPNRNPSPSDGYFSDIMSKIEDKLLEFKIDGQVINILKGPVVDTFELKLGPGVKVSKVKNSSEDLSMALMGAPIRIVYPMIGRDTVGIEVPRNPREIIYLDEVLGSKEFQDSRHRLPVAMGRNAFGETFVVDLAGMPHMLVAGATGAGKSVFINTLLVSLLVKRSPSQMKLILIDPKQLELALYAKLPHLMMPVLTDPKSASIALTWAAQEMERRYSILKEFQVRNIEGFNEKLKRATPQMLGMINQFYENEPSEQYELPYLVIIIDEFADLILTKAGKEIENNICRLAAKARAAGIHLVIATQRPSVDVITGLIKSNFPTRVSFRVTSPVDSRTILNTMGAEKLLGKGDMLYRQGTSTIRVHSSYVDEEEIDILTSKLSQMDAGFHQGAVDFLENGGQEEVDPYAFGSHISPVSDSDTDDLFSKAVEIVVESNAASASFLQRRLKIGYNRAARLIEEMEEKGIVGPAEGSKRRKVLAGARD